MGCHRLRLVVLIVWCECAVFESGCPIAEANKPCLVASGCPCVESTAARSTCTAVDQELYTLTTAVANGGTACTGSSTKCVQGDIPVCTCPNGTPTIATGAADTLCVYDGEDCSACDAGYHLSGAAAEGTATTCVGETLSRLDPHTEYTSRFNLSILSHENI